MNTSKDYLQNALLVIAAYLLCHGLTAWIVTPIQSYFLSDVTVFASLVYLPHGVRVLSVWLLGWRAALPLAMAAFLSEYFFTSAHIYQMLQSSLMVSIAVGVLSVYVAFAGFRGVGVDLSFMGKSRMSWRQLLAVGAFASVLNSLGQTVVFSHHVSAQEEFKLIAVYFVGDLFGQVVAMFLLMLLFRALRLSAPRTSH